jgi:F-type H+-transporting ATPase subunit alpha
MKKVAGRLRLDLAQYRALEAFAQLGSELDKASQQQLSRGARVVEVLKQPQYDPQPVERQVLAIYAVTGGYLDGYPVEDAKRFVSTFIDFVEARHPAVLSSIRDTGDLSDDIEATIKEALGAFAATFVATGSEDAGVAGHTPPDAVREDVGWDRMSSVDGDDEPGGADLPDEPAAPAG